MTCSILGRAAIAAGITAVLAGTAQAQGAAKGAPRLVLGDARALIICAPVTTVKSPPTIRQFPKAQPKAGPRPVTSLRRVPWPDKAAMFNKAGIAVMTEDSSSMFVLAGNETIASNGQGALWSSPQQSLHPDGVVEPGGEVTVGVQGRFAREHPSLQLHFYVQNNSPYAWTMHSLIDGSDIDVPLKPKVPVDIVILVSVPANLVADDRLDVVYGLVTLGLTQKVPWEFHRVEVMPISTR
jgi:hypothetical protein